MREKQMLRGEYVMLLVVNEEILNEFLPKYLLLRILTVNQWTSRYSAELHKQLCKPVSDDQSRIVWL